MGVTEPVETEPVTRVTSGVGMIVVKLALLLAVKEPLIRLMEGDVVVASTKEVEEAWVAMASPKPAR